MKKDNKVIKCDVNSCIHNNKKSCSLNEIKVSCSCCSDDVNCKNDTVCNSFEIIEKKES
jgi:hypothetical protein